MAQLDGTQDLIAAIETTNLGTNEEENRENNTLALESEDQTQRVTERREPTEKIEPTEKTELTETKETTEITELTETKETTEITEPTESKETTEITEPTESKETTEITEPTESKEVKEQTEIDTLTAHQEDEKKTHAEIESHIELVPTLNSESAVEEVLDSQLTDTITNNNLIHNDQMNNTIPVKVPKTHQTIKSVIDDTSLPSLSIMPHETNRFRPIGPTDEEFQLKSIKFLDTNGIKRSIKIITQNENGPCPMIALCNALILHGKLKIPYDQTSITTGQVVSILADLLLSKEINVIKTKLTSVDDMLEILPSLSLGLDVNVRFGDVEEFEESEGLDLFHAFGIRVFHGWIIDPSDQDQYELLTGLSYNQAVEKVVIGDEISRGTVVEDIYMTEIELEQAVEENRNLTDLEKDQIRQAMIVSHFLEKTKTQLTLHGLMKLYEKMKENEVCVLFRNNHFSTIHKRDSIGLFVLVTDAVFAQEPNIAWESLSDIDQSSADFYNDEFGKSSTIGGDYVQREERNERNERNEIEGGGDADLALALELQQEEEHREAVLRENEQRRQQQLQQQQQQQEGGLTRTSLSGPSQQNAQPVKKKKKDKDCIIM